MRNLGKWEACELEKSPNLPFNGTIEEASAVSEIGYSDVTDPFRTTYDDFRYAITFTDSFSRHLSTINATKKELKISFLHLFVLSIPADLEEDFYVFILMEGGI